MWSTWSLLVVAVVVKLAVAVGLVVCLLVFLA
jgi:hypothetical protein